MVKAKQSFKQPGPDGNKGAMLKFFKCFDYNENGDEDRHQKDFS